MKTSAMLACANISKGHFAGLQQYENLPTLGMEVSNGKHAKYSLFDTLTFRLMGELMASCEFTANNCDGSGGAPVVKEHRAMPASLASFIAAKFSTRIEDYFGSQAGVFQSDDLIFAVWAPKLTRADADLRIPSGETAWIVGEPWQIAEHLSAAADSNPHTRWANMVWLNVTGAARDVLHIALELQDPEAIKLAERIKNEAAA